MTWRIYEVSKTDPKNCHFHKNGKDILDGPQSASAEEHVQRLNNRGYDSWFYFHDLTVPSVSLNVLAKELDINF